MSFYRLYFLDEKGGIAAREELNAPSDQDAAEVCRVVADACSETYRGYEIWNLARLVSRVADISTVRIAAVPSWAEMKRARQEQILEMEDAIQSSRWRVARSKLLIETMSDLRTNLAQSRPSSPSPGLSPKAA